MIDNISAALSPLKPIFENFMPMITITIILASPTTIAFLVAAPRKF